jgi:formylglycine-generating enzyme required for sulfatase activity
MNTIKYLLIITVFGLAALYSCSSSEAIGNDDLPPQSGPAAVKLAASTGQPATRTTYGDSTIWVNNDSIGVYMMAHNDAIDLSIAENRLYTVVDGSLPTVFLQPATINQTIYYPNSGNVQFIAYYPWKAGATGGIIDYKYPVDISNQADTTHLDLLYTFDDNGTSGYARAQAHSTVNLKFDHMMSKIIVNVTTATHPSPGITIQGMKATINSMPAKATFKLADSTLVDVGQPQAIGMYGIAHPAAGYDTTYQAIVIPHSIAAGQEKIQFVTGEGRQFTWIIPQAAIAGFARGMVYTFNLTLQDEAHITYNATITPWGSWNPPTGEDIDDVPHDTTGTPGLLPIHYNQVTKRYVDTMAVAYIHPYRPFMMGNPAWTTTSGTSDGAMLASAPVRKVTLTHSYMIGQYEVTNAQYARFLNDIGATRDASNYGIYADLTTLLPGAPGGNKTTLGAASIAGSGSQATAGDVGVKYVNGQWTSAVPNQPMRYVNWYGAQAYAVWAGGSLPTEAQWEYAAKAGTTTEYYDGSPTGAGMTAYANYNTSLATAVGLKSPNLWNIYDIYGNVFEWCLDRYTSMGGYDSNQPVNDPEGTTQSIAENTYGIIRGGSYGSPVTFLPAARRFSYQLNNTWPNDWVGFRVVFNLK